MAIYLHEIIRVVPGREDDYMASVLSLGFIPARRRAGVKHSEAVGLFRTAQHSGPSPAVINIWQHEGWNTLTGALARQFQDHQRDGKMEAWWQANTDLRRGGHDRVLLPADYSRDREGLARDGVRGRVFVHEIIKLPMGEPARYLDRLGALQPLLGQLGWDVVGAYRVAWRPREAVVLWALPDWETLGSLHDAAADPELRTWNEYKNGVVQNLDEMVLLPGRMNPLALRD